MTLTTITMPNAECSEKAMKQLPRDKALASLVKKPIEAIYESDKELVACPEENAFAQAAHDAFYNHYPLDISPDAIWFCIGQGFAHHVAQHSEELRHHFVSHEGKKKLVLERQDFELGQPNPWPEAFASFSEQIGDHIGKLKDAIVADFSTTGPIERAAFEVLLMDAFQPYFEYEVRAGCGIPSFQIRGTTEDWISLRQRASLLAEYGLEEWMGSLLPVLDKIVDSTRGKADIDFWRSFFRYQSGSGPAELTGWIHVLFPYLRNLPNDNHDNHDDQAIEALQFQRSIDPHLEELEKAMYKAFEDGTADEVEQCAQRHQAAIESHPLTEEIEELRRAQKQALHWNPYMQQWKEAFQRADTREGYLHFGAKAEGPGFNSIPPGLASTPVRYVYIPTGEVTMLRFIGGMFGVVQDPDTLALAAEFGWAIVYEEAQE